jgi:pilus assembly protein TadC
MSDFDIIFSSVLFGLSVVGVTWYVLRQIPGLLQLEKWGRLFSAVRANGPAEVMRDGLIRFCQRVRPWLAPVVRPDPSLRGRLQLLGFAPDFDEASWMAARLFSGMVLPVLGYVLPDLWMRGAVASERDKAQRGFPAVLDGLALSLEAGQSFAHAMGLSAQRAADGPSQRWRRSLSLFAAELRSGGSKPAAVMRLQNALPLPVVQQFGALVLVADQAGLSMGKILRAQSSQARRLYQLQIEERAMKAPVKLMGPLVCCIFPCTFIVLLAPLLVKLTESLGAGV